MLLLIILACGQRHVRVDVEMPAEEPRPEATYTASTTTWRPLVSRAAGGDFEADHEGLRCEVEGRLLTAEVQLKGSDWPPLPATWHCVHPTLWVDVTLVPEGGQ